MMKYPNQPTGKIVADVDLGQITRIISAVLEDRLPDCETNKWFIQTVHYPNMIGEIIRAIREELNG
jgi:hypothetical protein